MKTRFFQILALFCFTLAPSRAAEPAEKLLPDDTLFFLTVPSVSRFRTIFASTPQGKLWRDPAMKPFRDKLTDRLSQEVATPLERAFGIKFSDYADLAQGQFTVALVQNGWQGKSNQAPALVILVDAGERSEQLKRNLTELKKKWTDGGRQIKTEKIRDVEFTTLITTTDDLRGTLKKALPFLRDKDEDDAPKEKTSAGKFEVLVGQSGSLLVAGTSAKPLEKVLARQTGGLAPALADQAAFGGSPASMFHDSHLLAWVNLKPLVDVLVRTTMDEPRPKSPAAPSPEKVISALGLNGLKTFALSYRDTGDGLAMHFSLIVPESGRQGLFKLLVPDAKDARAPGFVPAEVDQFTRTRINLQKAWATLESTIQAAVPGAAGGLKLMFDYTGKDKDPNFDLRRELIGNLGDDLVSYSKPPTANSGSASNAPAGLFLIGSPNPQKLANAIKVVVSSLGQASAQLKEREFLGRKIITFTPPTMAVAAEGPGSNESISFSAGNGYVAISQDAATLEEYLRNSEQSTKPLAETPGLREAAEKVGGMNTGFFGYANQREGMRVAFNTLKKLGAATGHNPSRDANAAEKEEKSFKDWLDFSLLPQFDTVSKYFYFSVYAGGCNADGYFLKIYSPLAPEAKK